MPRTGTSNLGKPRPKAICMKDAMKQKAGKQDTNSENLQKLSVKERFEERLSLVISHLEENLKDKGKAKIPILKETKQGKNKAGSGTVSAALKTVRAGSKALVEAMNKQVELSSICLNKKLNGRALERDFLTNEWPWPEHLPESLPLKALIAMVDPTPPGEIDWSKEEASSWPPKAAPLKVAEWAQKKLDKFRKGLGRSFLEAVKGKQLPKQLTHEELEIPIPTAGLALLYLAKDEITEGLKRPAIYVDASTTNHDMLRSWQKVMPAPTNETKIKFSQETNRIELFSKTDKNLRAQLSLPFEEWSLNGAIAHALAQMVRPFGLRNWWAVLRLFSVEGGRQGWVRWTMKDHLDALGLSQRSRENSKRLDEISDLVRLFTKLELAIYDKEGKKAETSPLILVGKRYEQLEGSRWQLDGMELKINPFIYQGVRNMETGELGNRFFPAPIELARIDHRNNRHASILGGILPIRWQWNLFGKDKLDYLAISGEKLLELAHIKPIPTQPQRAWDQLDRALEILIKIEMVGRYKWKNRPYTNKGIIRIYPHIIWLDRTVGGLKPIELPPVKIPRNGAELKEWRKKEELNQKEAAEKLKVTKRTLQRAEANKDKSLGKSILRGFERLIGKEDDKKETEKGKNGPSK